jgi:plasmid stabilization system protein ParE
MKWKLSLQALRDLEGIFDYTAKEHGPDQAFKYTKTFDDKFDKLLDNPKLVRELAKGERRDVVLVDEVGIVYNLARQIKGSTAKDIRARLNALNPPPVSQVQGISPPSLNYSL